MIIINNNNSQWVQFLYKPPMTGNDLEHLLVCFTQSPPRPWWQLRGLRGCRLAGGPGPKNDINHGDFGWSQSQRQKNMEFFMGFHWFHPWIASELARVHMRISRFWNWGFNQPTFDGIENHEHVRFFTRKTWGFKLKKLNHYWIIDDSRLLLDWILLFELFFVDYFAPK
jgi:hypothetical protein